MAPGADPDEITAHYAATDEGARLASGLGELELVRTRELIRRHLPGGPLRILDVGGATGIHAGWLLDDGHEVHLVDPMPFHVDAAVAALGSRPGFTASVGDARRLEQPDAAFDAVLLLGPLYHLTGRADRLKAWAEACRVVLPGGAAFGAVISRFASLLDGLARGYLFEPGFGAIVERDLRDGQHRNPEQVPGWFTTAYLHRPDEVAGEAEAAGLAVRAVLGVEGIAAWLGQLGERWDDPGSRGVIVDAARAVEAEPSLLGVSPHLLCIAERSR